MLKMLVLVLVGEPLFKTDIPISHSELQVVLHIYARAVANDPEVFVAYFDLLEETLSQNNLLDDKPNSIFNCDESGFSLDPKTGNLLG